MTKISNPVIKKKNQQPSEKKLFAPIQNDNLFSRSQSSLSWSLQIAHLTLSKLSLSILSNNPSHSKKKSSPDFFKKMTPFSLKNSMHQSKMATSRSQKLFLLAFKMALSHAVKISLSSQKRQSSDPPKNSAAARWSFKKILQPSSPSCYQVSYLPKISPLQILSKMAPSHAQTLF